MKHLAQFVLLLGGLGTVLNFPHNAKEKFDPKYDLLFRMALSVMRSCPKYDTDEGMYDYFNFAGSVTQSVVCLMQVDTEYKNSMTAAKDVQLETDACIKADQKTACLAPVLDDFADCFEGGNHHSNVRSLEVIASNITRAMECGSLQNFDFVKMIEGGKCSQVNKCGPIPINSISAPISNFSASQCSTLAEIDNCIRTSYADCDAAGLLRILFDSLYHVNMCNAKITSGHMEEDSSEPVHSHPNKDSELVAATFEPEWFL